MKYARANWKQERASWRAVIQLNLIRSVITLVDTLQAEMDTPPEEYDPTRDSTDSIVLEPRFAIPLTDKHQLLKLRLGPLRRVETDLKRRLGAGADEVTNEGGGVLDGLESQPKEFCVRGWKSALEGPGAMVKAMKGGGSRNGHAEDEKAMPVDEATEVIARCKEDMKMLWEDDAVKAVLTRRRIRLEDSAGLYVPFPSFWPIWCSLSAQFLERPGSYRHEDL
jgi:hypothetical protein